MSSKSSPTIFHIFKLPPNRIKFQLFVLSLLAFSFSILFAFLQEKISSLKGYREGKGYVVMTNGTMLVHCLLGLTEMLLLRDFSVLGIFSRTDGNFLHYVVLAVTTFCGHFFTNWSLQYLSYPTRVVSKSIKVLPVMIVATSYGTRYSTSDWMSAVVLALGVLVFTLGDSKANPNFDIFGIFLVSLGIISDSYTSNIQKEKFFKIKEPVSSCEVMFVSSLIGLALGSFTSILKGDLPTALNYLSHQPQCLYYTFLSATSGYFSVWFILALVKFFDPSAAEIVKSLRKVGSIILSFLFFPKPLSVQYGVGFVLVVFSCVDQFNSQSRRRMKDLKKLD